MTLLPLGRDDVLTGRADLPGLTLLGPLRPTVLGRLCGLLAGFARARVAAPRTAATNRLSLAGVLAEDREVTALRIRALPFLPIGIANIL